MILCSPDYCQGRFRFYGQVKIFGIGLLDKEEELAKYRDSFFLKVDLYLGVWNANGVDEKL